MVPLQPRFQMRALFWIGRGVAAGRLRFERFLWRLEMYRVAQRAKGGKQGRRPLGIAAALYGSSQVEAPKIGWMDRRD
jgi:hypothetical protein